MPQPIIEVSSIAILPTRSSIVLVLLTQYLGKLFITLYNVMVLGYSVGSLVSHATLYLTLGMPHKLHVNQLERLIGCHSWLYKLTLDHIKWGLCLTFVWPHNYFSTWLFDKHFHIPIMYTQVPFVHTRTHVTALPHIHTHY